jgi:hypothetical protein
LILFGATSRWLQTSPDFTWANRFKLLPTSISAASQVISTFSWSSAHRQISLQLFLLEMSLWPQFVWLQAALNFASRNTPQLGYIQSQLERFELSAFFCASFP